MTDARARAGLRAISRPSRVGRVPTLPDSVIDEAVIALRAGRLVAFPTETVYGLGADARSFPALRRVFEAKRRPRDHPLIVHLADTSEIDAWARVVPRSARDLFERFAPGPLTIVLSKRADVHDAVTGGQETIGLRVPDHPVALALLAAFGGGIAAPSARAASTSR